MTDNANNTNNMVLTQRGFKAIQEQIAALEELLQRRIDQLADTDRQLALDNPDAGVYLEAEIEKEHLQQRIERLKDAIAQAEVRDEDPNPTLIDPGERVVLWDYVEEQEVVYELVAGAEAVQNRQADDDSIAISVESPVGQALVGRQVGDVIEVPVPDGTARYAVRRIEQITE